MCIIKIRSVPIVLHTKPYRLCRGVLYVLIQSTPTPSSFLFRPRERERERGGGRERKRERGGGVIPDYRRPLVR